MKWLENNPVGVGLAVTSGVLLLIVLLLAWAWSWPASSGPADADAAAGVAADIPSVNNELGPLSSFQEVNNRPVFNETRRPVVEIGASEFDPDEELVPTGAPEVRLTGVVITPETRLVTLTPSGEGEPVIALEGQPLEGEYAGWSVTAVKPRQVTLESNDGSTLDFDLMVHDQMIDKPPEPEPPVENRDGNEGGGEEGAEPPLTRAEEIRQRIQERREQLRREAEEEAAETEAENESKKTTYQEAIRSMMNRRGNEEDENTEEDD